VNVICFESCVLYSSGAILGTLSNDDGNAKENFIEIVVFGSFILPRDYSNPLNLSNVAELFGN